MINEHDIRDFDGQKWEVKRNVKLYEVPRNSWIYFNEYPTEGLLQFRHIDGMYSVCMDSEGYLLHLSAASVVDYWKPVDAPESP